MRCVPSVVWIFFGGSVRTFFFFGVFLFSPSRKVSGFLPLVFLSFCACVLASQQLQLWTGQKATVTEISGESFKIDWNPEQAGTSLVGLLHYTGHQILSRGFVSGALVLGGRWLFLQPTYGTA